MQKTSSIPSLRILGKSVGLAITASLASCLALVFPAFAQTTSDIDPLEDFQTEDGNTDILSGSQQSIQDLIHRITLSVDLSMDEFTEQRQENILSEADRFRELQRVRIEQERLGVDTADTMVDPDAVTDSPE